MNDFWDKYSQIKLVHKIAGVFLFAVVTAVIHWQLFFQEQEYNQLLIRREELEAKKVEFDAKLRSARFTEELNNKIDQRLAEKKVRLPNTTEIESIMREVNRKGTETGVKVIKFFPQKEEIKELYVEQPISLELQGTFHETLNFLFMISKGTRIVNMHDIIMEKPEYKNQKTVIVSKLDLKVYRFRKETDKLPEVKK